MNGYATNQIYSNHFWRCDITFVNWNIKSRQSLNMFLVLFSINIYIYITYVLHNILFVTYITWVCYLVTYLMSIGVHDIQRRATLSFLRNLKRSIQKLQIESWINAYKINVIIFKWNHGCWAISWYRQHQHQTSKRAENYDRCPIVKVSDKVIFYWSACSFSIMTKSAPPFLQ